MSEYDDKTAISSRGRVLLLDHDDARRKAMTERLEENLFHVRAYATGDDALAKAVEFDPDVVLFDISQLDACRRFRQRQELAQVPIVFVTERDDEATTLLALAAGGSDFLARDASVPILIARLSSLVALRRAQRQLLKLAAK